MDYPWMNNTARVRHGFSGQQMVVLPRPVVAELASHPLMKGLYPTDAGYFPEAQAHGVERREGVAAAILIVCQAGRGWVRLGNGAPILRVKAGEAVVIAPGQPHSYGADDTEAWTIQWVHFSGLEVSEWWRWHELPELGGVLQLRAGDPEKLDLGRVHEQLAAGYDERHLLAASAALRWSLANLVPASLAESATNTAEVIETVEAWMRENPGGRPTLEKLSRRANLSPAHFSVMFRRRYGFSPIDYYLRLKIRRACTLLDTTDWPVGRVGAELGVEDPLYFSRLFRRVMGLAPRDYRRAKKG